MSRGVVFPHSHHKNRKSFANYNTKWGIVATNLTIFIIKIKIDILKSYLKLRKNSSFSAPKTGYEGPFRAVLTLALAVSATK